MRPRLTSDFQGQGDANVRPARETILRTRENPLEWTPEEARPMRTSPTMMLEEGRIKLRSTAPTAKPARS